MLDLLFVYGTVVVWFSIIHNKVDACRAAPEEEGKTSARDSAWVNSAATVFDQYRHSVATDQASQAEKQMGVDTK